MSPSLSSLSWASLWPRIPPSAQQLAYLSTAITPADSAARMWSSTRESRCINSAAIIILASFLPSSDTMRHTRSSSPEPDPIPTEAPTVGDIPTFDTRANTDVFHIAESSPSRSPSPAPSVAPRRPWYKRPSPLWLFPLTVLSTILMAGTIAPRTELYIRLACNELHPDYLILPPPILVSLGDDIPNDPDTPIYVPPPPKPNKPAINIPGPNKMCTADPQVQAAIAKLQTMLTTGMGVLTCLTTGSWAQLSDRVGRTRILALTSLGLLATDIVLILVAFYADILPGGYRFLIVGNLIDGALGGFTTASAASHAYISDTVTPASRSRLLSLYIGAVFGGMALGPTLAAIVIEQTNDLLTVFYASAGLHLFGAIFLLFILPESLDEKHRAAARERYNASRGPTSTWLSSLKHMVFTFARPLVVFIPRRRPRGKGRDWSLTLIGIAFASAMLNMGSYAFKFQYALAAFGWGTTELGYWMSMVGVTRATHLVLILPLLLKGLQMLYRGRRHTYVDLFVARLSLSIELLGYITMAMIMDPKLFAITTCWMSLGGGFAPSVQSLALALSQDQAKEDKLLATPSPDDTSSNSGDDEAPATPTETGRLFGALSVLQSLTSQIVGPSLFGLVFVKTIGSAPRAIFWVSAGCVFASLMALGMVRLKKEETVREETDEESPLLH